MSRAISTATPAANATGLKPLTIDPRLSELDFGEVEGMTIAEAEKRFREAIQRFRADPEHNPMPGGEDPLNAAARAIEVLYKIANAHPNGRVLVVSHNTLIRLALCSLFGIPLARYRAIFPEVINCALTEIRFRDKEVALLRYNSDVAPIVNHQSSKGSQ